MSRLVRSTFRALLFVPMLGGCNDDGRHESASSWTTTHSTLAVGGGAHFLVYEDGRLASWGSNEIGRALPDSEDPLYVPPPTIVDVGSSVVAVASGTQHACAIVEEGRVKCWGGNDSGQLGLGDTEARGDQSGEMGERLPFVELGNRKKASMLATSGSFTCALFDDGAIKCWGSNTEGWLGLGDTEDRGDDPGEMGDALPELDLGTSGRAVDVDVGGGFACAVLDTGAVKCWGSNEFWQLGNSTLGTLGDQPGEMGDALPTVALGADAFAIGVSAGGSHACALFEDGGVKCWGRGSEHPCDTDPDLIPCWEGPRYGGGRLGYGDMEKRGAPQDMGDNLPFVDLGADEHAIAIALGGIHSCAVLQGGRAKCWGSGQNYRLGNESVVDIGDEPGEMGDDLAAIDLGSGAMIERFATWGTDAYTTCASLAGRSVKCWGILDDADPVGAKMGDDLPTIHLPM